MLLDIWAYDADGKMFTLFSRQTGDPVCQVSDLEFAAANLLAHAADKLFAEGVEYGKRQLREAVLDAVNGGASRD